MMLTLGVIDVNPTGVSAITWFGVVFLALVAAVLVGLWAVVAARLARRGADELGGGADDRGREALRHLRLLVRRPRDQQAAVVAELAPEQPNQAARPKSG